jgi:hypothetical protein
MARRGSDDGNDVTDSGRGRSDKRSAELVADLKADMARDAGAEVADSGAVGVESPADAQSGQRAVREPAIVTTDSAKASHWLPIVGGTIRFTLDTWRRPQLHLIDSELSVYLGPLSFQLSVER